MNDCVRAGRRCDIAKNEGKRKLRDDQGGGSNSTFDWLSWRRRGNGGEMGGFEILLGHTSTSTCSFHILLLVPGSLYLMGLV